MKKNHRRSRKGKGDTFDPQDEALVEHRQLGVWDLYTERYPKLSRFPTLWKVEVYAGMWNDLPYLWRTIHDVCTIAWPLLLLYVAIMAMTSLVPALNLWYVSFHLSDKELLISLPGSLAN